MRRDKNTRNGRSVPLKKCIVIVIIIIIPKKGTRRKKVGNNNKMSFVHLEEVDHHCGYT